MRLLYLLLFCSLLLSCGKPMKKEQENSRDLSEILVQHKSDGVLLEYVCVDKNECLHSTRRCGVLDSLYNILYIDTASLKSNDFVDVCSHCIDYCKYNHILSIIKDNEGSDIDWNQYKVN